MPFGIGYNKKPPLLVHGKTITNRKTHNVGQNSGYRKRSRVGRQYSGSIVTAEHERGVDAAESESVGQHMIDFGGTRSV